MTNCVGWCSILTVARSLFTSHRHVPNFQSTPCSFPFELILTQRSCNLPTKFLNCDFRKTLMQSLKDTSHLSINVHTYEILCSWLRARICSGSLFLLRNATSKIFLFTLVQYIQVHMAQNLHSTRSDLLRFCTLLSSQGHHWAFERCMNLPRDSNLQIH
jgi:hypothetical protein